MPKSGMDLVKLGILPNLKGVYSFDESDTSIDAVFLSHSHMDHAAHISFLKRNIPVYCGETTATILNALNDVRPTSVEFNLNGIKFRTFRTNNRIRVSSMEVIPIHVDHSVPGSYGFIIHTSSGTIVYTGDFRWHGSKPELTEDFVLASANEEADALICESTNMTEVEVSSESEVMSKINSLVSNTSSLVLTEFACADIDRLRSFHEVSLKNNRLLVISPRQAYLLYKLEADAHLNVPKITDGSILIFQKEKKRYFRWEQEVMDLGEPIGPNEISRIQNKIILYLSFFDLSWLVDIDPSPGSCYILSASEPFNEEMEIDFDRLLNWLEYYGLPQYHIHVSGHIIPVHLRRVLEIIKPKKVFPIHGTHVRLLKRYVGDLHSKIIEPEIGREYNI